VPGSDVDIPSRWPAGLAVAALIVAALVRFAFLAGKPFWIDEAWVATLVGQPLGTAVAQGRPVPIGLVAVAKLAALVPGMSPEVGLRLLPVACGLGAVAAIGQLALELGESRRVALTATWLAAGLPALVNYSRELKPYSIDAFVAAILPVLALRALAPGRTSTRATWAMLLLLLGVAPWVSFGTVFPILAVLTWGATRCWREADRSTRVMWMVGVGLYLGSFAVAYAVGLGAQSTAPRIQAMWRDALLDVHGIPGPRAIAIGLSRYVRYSAPFLFPGGLWLCALPLAAVGAVTWPAPRRPLLWWLAAGTAAFTVAAALMDRYALSGRLLLFTAPTYVLCLAAGLGQVGRWLPARPGRHLAPAIAMALAVYWSGAALAHRVDPDPPDRFMRDVLHDLDPLIARVADLAGPDDAVFASSGTGLQFLYYARGRFPDATACHPYDCRDEPAAAQRWLGRIHERGWMLLLADEDQPWLRLMIDGAGFERRDIATGRGTRLWEVRRRG
jgi:hypothetical protein